MQTQAQNLLAHNEELKLRINDDLLQYMLTGLLKNKPSKVSDEKDNPNPEVFTPAIWKQLHELTTFDVFESLIDDIIENQAAWMLFMRADKNQFNDLLPDPYQSTL